MKAARISDSIPFHYTIPDVCNHRDNKSRRNGSADTLKETPGDRQFGTLIAGRPAGLASPRHEGSH
jgi:hypothetical protein